MSNQRKDYISWDTYFMGVAKLSAMRSKDPSTQVGACIVSKDNKILSVGYNGAPKGFEDDEMPWDREGEFLNAILNSHGANLEDSKIYVDLFPCNECAKAIIQAGIKEVIYLSDKYSNTESNIASKRLLSTCNVKCRQYKSENNSLTIEL